MNHTLASTVAVLVGPFLFTASAQNGTWRTGLASISARALGAAATVSGRVYMVGGGNYSCGITSALQGYDPVSNVWSNLASMPTARYEFGAAELNGLLYAIAGNPGCGSPGNAIKAVEAYDPAANTWSSKASLPSGTWDAGVASVNGQIYVIGGLTGAVYAYDPLANAWTTKAPLPLPYSGGAVGVVNGVIYVIGGTAGSQNTVQAYNTTTDSWTTKAPLPTPRYECAGATLNGLIYVVGGYSSTGAVATVEVYNPATDAWNTVAPAPLRVWGASAAVANGELYVMGGFDINNNTVTSVEVFTPNTLITGIATYAGLTLTGTVGSTNRIDVRNNLAATNWTALTNLILPSNPYLFIDPTPASGAGRFYRVVEQ